MTAGTAPLVCVGLELGDLRRGLNGPLLDAMQMKDVKTARALPDGLVTSYILIADHALALVLSQLLGEDLGSRLILRRRSFAARRSSVRTIGRSVGGQLGLRLLATVIVIGLGSTSLAVRWRS